MFKKHPSWFRERRLDYIEDMLVEHGQVKTKEVADYFDISTRIVLEDIRAYLYVQKKADYNGMIRGFVSLHGFKPIRRSTQARRDAWALWSPKHRR